MAGSANNHVADGHDVIEVRGARENNLKNIDIDIPKRRLSVFTGVSGSGKSSLVFGVIAAESQRLINETYSAFLQTFMASPSRPDVDDLKNVSAAIIVDQERMGANARSTVGTATDAYAMLRVLFSSLGQPHVGPSTVFSFNVPAGMCPRCDGTGEVNEIALAQLYDETKSLAGGAITIPGFTADGWAVRSYIESGFLDANKPIREYSDEELQSFLYRAPEKLKISGINMTYEGLIPKVQKSLLGKDRDSLQPHVRAFVDRAMTFTECPECQGSRLNQAALSSKIAGRNIAEVSSMPINDLAEWLDGISDTNLAPLISNLQNLVASFINIGLGYLGLNRPTGTLSGGEAQRVKMVRHLGSALTDITYVFDEPSTGLHPHDIQRMNELLLKLRDKGNTVLVVEHKPEVIAIADHVIDLGPGAGSKGGTIQYSGSLEGLRKSETLTGRHLHQRAVLRAKSRKATGQTTIKNASQHNLKDVTVNIPHGIITVVTGVAGSGKSTLIHQNLPSLIGNVVTVDQTAIRGSRRSNPATYTGLLDPIRALFAKENGVKPNLFSANSAGACPNCKGIGLVFTELSVMASVSSICEDCEGKRFTPEVLIYTVRGKNIHEVLTMSVDEALEHFNEKPITAILERLNQVGLGYLGLGQALNTLSGGERQRLKLAINMGKPGNTYILDEPTTGLHLADIDKLLSLLDQLVDEGNNVIVIEHHQAVMAHADWIIDIGPGAGNKGGTIVFEGTPAELVDYSGLPGSGKGTLTGQHLREYLG